MDTDENGHTRHSVARAAAGRCWRFTAGSGCRSSSWGDAAGGGARTDGGPVGRRPPDRLRRAGLPPGQRRRGPVQRGHALEKASPPDATAAQGGGVRTFARIYVITDRQASSWKEVDDAFPAHWKERLGQAQVAARLFVLPVGSGSGDNVAVEEVKLTNGPLVAGQPAQLQVTLRNYGQVRWASLPLTVSIDRRVVAEQRVNLAPGRRLVLPITLKDGFYEPGSYLVTAEIGRQPTGPAAPR